MPKTAIEIDGKLKGYIDVPEGTPPDVVRQLVNQKFGSTEAKAPIGASAETIGPPSTKDVFREGATVSVQTKDIGRGFSGSSLMDLATGARKTGEVPDEPRSRMTVPGIGSASRGTLRAAGQIGGSLMFGPAGYIGGSLLGDTLGQILEKGAPGYFGKIEDDGEGLGAAAFNTAVEGGMDLVTGGATKFLSRLKGGGLSTSVGKRIKSKLQTQLEARGISGKEAEEILKQQDLVGEGGTAFDLTDNIWVKRLNEKDITTRANKQIAAGKRRIEATLNKTKGMAPEERIPDVHESYKEQYKNFRKLEEAKWNEFYAKAGKEPRPYTEVGEMQPEKVVKVEVGKDPHTGQPILEDKVIPPRRSKGEQRIIHTPVNTAKSAEFAQTVLEQLDEVMKDLPEYLQRKRSNIISTLETMSKPHLNQAGEEVFVHEFATLRDLKTDLNQMIAFHGKTDKITGQIKALNGTIDEALDEAAAKFAPEEYAKAVNTSKVLNRNFNKKTRSGITETGFADLVIDPDPEFLNWGIKDSYHARKFIASTTESGRQQLTEHYVNDLIQNRLLQNLDEVSVNSIQSVIQELQRVDSPANVLLSAQQKNRTVQLARAMERNQKQLGDLGHSSVVAWRQGYMAVQTATGIAGAVAGGATGNFSGVQAGTNSALVGGGLLALTFAPAPIIRKFLLDPKFGKELVAGVKAGPQTAQGKFLTRKLMAKLTGFRAFFTTDTGDKKYVRIVGNKGKGYIPISKEEYDEWNKKQELE